MYNIYCNNTLYLYFRAIMSVTMQNFMCHQKFVYTPVPCLNFLSGVNGSGKSAIMTAIVYTLGGSAKKSNRGSSNKVFHILK